MKLIYQTSMLFLLMSILCGIIYPSLITVIGQWFFYEQSNGSLLKDHEKIVGSMLIGQNFTAKKYFWPRPTPASNLGPTSKELLLKINERRSALASALNVDEKQIPDDLLTASASGHDPHISVAAAKIQVARVAKERSMATQKIIELINSQNKKIINVLMLNYSLDNMVSP